MNNLTCLLFFIYLMCFLIKGFVSMMRIFSTRPSCLFLVVFCSLVEKPCWHVNQFTQQALHSNKAYFTKANKTSSLISQIHFGEIHLLDYVRVQLVKPWLLKKRIRPSLVPAPTLAPCQMKGIIVSVWTLCWQRLLGTLPLWHPSASHFLSLLFLL